jgi:NAD(P)H-dependent flavin oxidoreductase YrpB (nitropropane dioxygenase family)
MIGPKQFPTPIIAAGGLSTGAHIREVLRAGATAAMLGTRFVATQESRAHKVYKQRLVESQQTALTNCFDGGWPNALHRVLRQGTLGLWESQGSPAKPNRPDEGRVVARNGERLIHLYDDDAPQAGVEGDVLAMCMYAGMGVGEIKDIPSAAELVTRLLKEIQN